MISIENGKQYFFLSLLKVLQHGVERELPLYNGSDEFGRLYITSLSSQPVEIDESRARDNELGISEEEESVTTESDTESDENKLDGVKKPRRNQAVSFATRVKIIFGSTQQVTVSLDSWL